MPAAQYCTEPHATPHAPQLETSLAAMQAPPQWSPLVHVHAPLEQISPGAQAVPHAPQFFASKRRSAHVAPHTESPYEEQVQTPLLQYCPAPHTFPHVPQLVGLVAVFTHCPEQSVGADDGQPHAPPVHTCPAPHAFPHAPQFAASVCRSTQPTPAQ